MFIGVIFQRALPFVLNMCHSTVTTVQQSNCSMSHLETVQCCDVFRSILAFLLLFGIVYYTQIQTKTCAIMWFVQCCDTPLLNLTIKLIS